MPVAFFSSLFPSLLRCSEQWCIWWHFLTYRFRRGSALRLCDEQWAVIQRWKFRSLIFLRCWVTFSFFSLRSVIIPVFCTCIKITPPQRRTCRTAFTAAKLGSLILHKKVHHCGHEGAIAVCRSCLNHLPHFGGVLLDEKGINHCGNSEESWQAVTGIWLLRVRDPNHEPAALRT